MPAARRSFQQGACHLVASSVSGKTNLTRVSHKAPVRLIPVTSSSLKGKSAVCAVGGYGGGMLQGDSNTINVTVDAGATLGVTAQGANRIYKHTSLDSEPQQFTKTIINATVAAEGLLVLAPDPCVLFADSCYSQQTNVELEDESSSLIMMDWFSAGRVTNGEYWNFASLKTRTQIYRNHEQLLTEAFDISNSISKREWYDCTTIVSVVLVGPQAQSVAREFESMARQLTSEQTQIRPNDDISRRSFNTDSLGGKTWLSMTQVKQDDVHVARIAATSNEDVFRILRSCLYPLADKFGLPFYKNQIQSSATLLRTAELADISNVEPIEEEPQDASLSAATSLPSFTSKSLWSAFMLVDSGLPTGSFAHSSGLEVAHQFGLLAGRSGVKDYCLAATASTMQLSIPFVMKAYEIAASDEEDWLDPWLELNQHHHALLVTNGPAYRASLDQGQGLLRVAKAWSKNDNTKLLHEKLQQIPSQSTHVAPLFGFLTANLNVADSKDACRSLGYTLARDVVSAAIRLNAIGPLKSLEILEGAQKVVEESLVNPLALEDAAGCAPILDVLHPSHDLLHVRLFRS